MSTLKERMALAMQGPPKIKQIAIARGCGLDPSTVNDWVSGRTQVVQGENLLKAARFLNVNPEWLATGRGPMHGDRQETVKGSFTEGRASQSERPNTDTLRQAIRFARTFLLESGEAPDVEARADLVADAYEELVRAAKDGSDPIAFMGRMLAKLRGAESENQRQTDRGSGKGAG